MRTILLSLLLITIFTSPLLAVDVAPRISDREIIEKLLPPRWVLQYHP